MCIRDRYKHLQKGKENENKKNSNTIKAGQTAQISTKRNTSEQCQRPPGHDASLQKIEPAKHNKTKQRKAKFKKRSNQIKSNSEDLSAHKAKMQVKHKRKQD